MNYIRTGQIPDEKHFTKAYPTPVEAAAAQKLGDPLKDKAFEYLTAGASFIGGKALTGLVELKEHNGRWRDRYGRLVDRGFRTDETNVR